MLHQRQQLRMVNLEQLELFFLGQFGQLLCAFDGLDGLHSVIFGLALIRFGFCIFLCTFLVVSVVSVQHEIRIVHGIQTSFLHFSTCLFLQVGIFDILTDFEIGGVSVIIRVFLVTPVQEIGLTFIVVFRVRVRVIGGGKLFFYGLDSLLLGPFRCPLVLFLAIIVVIVLIAAPPYSQIKHPLAIFGNAVILTALVIIIAVTIQFQVRFFLLSIVVAIHLVVHGIIVGVIALCAFVLGAGFVEGLIAGFGRVSGSPSHDVVLLLVTPG
mmetsp:Transcript_20286/g.42429  ORF Transcript_20286/g.42429 Transcript_20286/m.42429 type:complete len:268 (+) Transcript_20286:1349-2152(+)